MTKTIHYFESSNRRWIVPLDFKLDDWIAQWNALRSAMIRTLPPAFTRDEWAYLVSFLDPSQLRRPFQESFGNQCETLSSPRGGAMILARRRERISVWLPGNVSLLGPLVMIYASLGGASIRMKSSSEASDLAGAFLDFARANLPQGALKDYLLNTVRIEQFGREDPRNQEMALQSDVRIVFGSDAAVAAIDGLPHSAGAVGIAFGDHVSQAWISPRSVDDALVVTLIRVFGIYGQAGCTSPQRVILLGGNESDAADLMQRLCAMWPEVIARDVPMHVASANILAHQLARALGWQARITARNRSVICAGPIDLEDPQSLMTLPISYATLDEAAAKLPMNIQTIGYAISGRLDESWQRIIGRSNVKRVVPLARMHHFGPTWDGIPFWRQLFEEVELEESDAKEMETPQ